MKLNKTMAISAGVCAIALTAVSNQVFAADTKPATTVTTTQTKEATIVSKPGLGVLVWNEPNGKGTGKYLSNQSKIKFVTIKNVNGHAWYQLADNAGWVDGSYVKEDATPTKPNNQKDDTKKDSNDTASTYTTAANGIVKVTNAKGAIVYSKPNSAAKTTRTLPVNTNWKTFLAVHEGGLTWYNLGGSQYVLVTDVEYSGSNTTSSTKTDDSKDNSKADTNKSNDKTNEQKNTNSSSDKDHLTDYKTSYSGTVKVTSNAGAAVYSDTVSTAKTTRILPVNSNWKAFEIVHKGGLSWYNLGGKQYVLSTDISPDSNTATKPATPSTSTTTPTTNTTGTLKVNYLPGYGIRVWGQPGKEALNKTLKTGTNWKFFKTAQVNGKTWYNLGGNQWIDGQYAVVNGKINKKINSDGKVLSVYFSFGEVNYKPGYGIAIWTAPNGHVTGKYMKTGALVNINDLTQDGKWLKVSDSVTGQSGWVQASYINPVKIDG